MNAPRVWVPADQLAADQIALPPEAARHLTQALRRRIGAPLELLDGAGGRAPAELIETTSRRAVARRTGAVTRAPRPFPVTLVQGLPKSGKMDLIIQKAVELGATRLIGLACERSVVRLSAAEDDRLERWRRIAISALEQSGAPWLPEFLLAGSPADLPAAAPDEARWLGALDEPAPSLRAALTAGAMAAIGPEGDFTPAEYAALRRAGFAPVSLGPNILRTETAALYALAVLTCEYGG